RLLHSFLEIHPNPDTLILGIVSGKKYDEIAQILCPSFRSVIITTPGTFKPSDPGSLTTCCLRYNPTTHLIADPVEALQFALSSQPSSDAPILITGSFYLAGEILKNFSSPHTFQIRPVRV
ncbi:MAG: hypothetical protein KA771_07600, partial [Spirochaetales bacterium]|nr:hypothetical protein [Spirochaetales bacterium]